MKLKRKKHLKGVDYNDPKVRREVFERQRRDLWTPEQTLSFARHFKLRSGMKMLDAGCGHGYCLKTFGPFCRPKGLLLGLDVNRELVETARQKTARDRHIKSPQFVNGTIYGLPFKNNTFDIAISHVVFCHLDRPQDALDELIRVTRRGGCVAIFDNAVRGGGASGWTNVFKDKIRDELFNFEVNTRMFKGRVRLREGDFSVGCHLPGWMEQRGLKNVDARCNEKVQWMAPPYRSPAQQVLIQSMKERNKDRAQEPPSKIFEQYIRRLRAGGASEAMIKKHIRRVKARSKKWKQAMRKGRASLAQGYGGFWCVWGFKS